MSKSPDFTTMAYGADFPKPSFAEWRAQVEKATGKTLEQLVSATMEHIDVKPLYTRDDIKDLQHLGYVAGVPPFLRGPYPAMYVTQPWTVRQYAGFSTAEESNAFYRRNLAAGQKGLSIAFDLATHRGYDSDHQPRGRRCRQGRRGDRFAAGHEHPVRRHPARSDVGVDDHERRGVAGAGVLHRRRRGAGRFPRAS